MGGSSPWWAHRAGALALPAATVAAWQLASWAAGPDFLPSPWAAAGRALAGFREGWLWQELALTLMELAGGFAWAVVLGLGLGFALGGSALLRAAYEGPLVALYSIPKVTLFPLFLFAFKLGPASKVAFGAFHGLFPIAIYTWTAMSTVRPVYFKVARLLRLRPAAVFARIVLPAVAPAVVTGLRLGFNLTFLGVILGEMFASRAGLGFLLMSFGATFDATQILATILVIFAVALAGNLPLLWWERRLSRWSEQARR
ncbi:MAG TPA: ABC transporter permease subunit [Limnochordales bacterium]